MDVAVDRAPGLLRLTIHNGNRSPVVPPDGTGLGLVGMRERVEAVGGTLRHGPVPDGGFTVVAELPLPTGPMTAPTPIRVLIADDDEIVRAGFSALLETRDGIVVVGTARDGHDAVRPRARTTPTSS